MKLTVKQLKRMIKESLEQVDWDNPNKSWGANDQENRENEQSNYDSNAETEGIRQALFDIGLKAAHAGMDMQTLQEALHEGYGHGRMESEGEMVDGEFIPGNSDEY